MQTRTGELSPISNRIYFNEALSKALLQAKRHHTTLALLHIDIDGFTQIQTSQGPEKSHSILLDLGQRLAATLRSSDTITHMENDGFAVLLVDIKNPKLIGMVAEKLLQACPPSISISIGIAVSSEDGSSLEDMQKQTSNNLFKAKQSGGNNYQFSQPQMTLAANDYGKLQQALRLGISNNEFILYYQPKLDLKTQSITGAEALIRWKDSKLGLIDPMQFVPPAEESGLIVEMGKWALHHACTVGKRWITQGYQPISIAVNLSPKQFYHPQILETVEAVLNETDFPPQLLELEITEMTILDNIDKVNTILRGFRKLGVTISLDDFGTGNTAISYLKEFPVNGVKIDQSFIKPLPQDLQCAAITTTLITLAHQFGLKVVAEGVETREQLDYLTQQGCDLAQGYFISQPLPEEDMAKHLVK